VAHPDVDVRLDVSDRTLDLAAGEADVGVRCGPGDWKGLQATRLMDEAVIAVASPALMPPDGAFRTRIGCRARR
jgi:LysR family glycine cleavage system transcriptional activator